MSVESAATQWSTGRLDARRGPSRLLFGKMHEDVSIESAAFGSKGRIFCIASGGCTAIELARSHDVVAVDTNHEQIEHVERRLSGDPGQRGCVERWIDRVRRLAPIVGWNESIVRRFLDLEDVSSQVAMWRERLDTLRFRVAIDALLSRSVLRMLYSKPLVDSLPQPFGPVFRARLARGFGRFPNRTNPYARALILGEMPAPVAAGRRRVELVHADAAAFLESEPAASFDGFSLSNILDGTDRRYATRLLAAVRHAATPGATAVLRSFSEPKKESATNRARDDRSMLWGVVDVCSVDAL